MHTLFLNSIIQFEDMLRMTVGQDEGVEVGNIKCMGDGTYSICIGVKYPNQAQALRTLLLPVYTWGNAQICVEVTSQGERCGALSVKNQKEVGNVLCSALRTNYLFIGVFLEEQCFIPINSCIRVLIRPCNIPIRCGDRGGYTQEEAAQVFAQIMRRHFGTLICTEVFYEAYRKSCLPRCLYCKSIFLD